MTKTFTPNDVIRFIYGEIISAGEKKEFKDALNSNNDLSAFYLEMRDLMRSLNTIKKEPPHHVTDRILQFSKNYSLQVVPK
jgi:hypothetical protein